jgi:polyisoprenoid-binding protein YceI
MVFHTKGKAMLRIRQLMVLLVSLSSAPAWPATYQLDPSHTVQQFEIDHFWVFTQRGQFDRAHGTLEYDAEQHTGSLEVVIEAGSLATGNEERDATLKGPGWFDVSRYPTLSFRSQRFLFEQDRLVAIEGELTMHGVTQPMRLEVDRIKCGSNPLSSKWRCGADARGTLQRSRYGIRSSLPYIGDEVRLRIQVEAYRKN